MLELTIAQQHNQYSVEIDARGAAPYSTDFDSYDLAARFAHTVANESSHAVHIIDLVRKKKVQYEPVLLSV